MKIKHLALAAPLALVPHVASAQSAADRAELPISGDVAAELSVADTMGERGYEDVYAMSGTAGQTRSISLTSEAFDTYIYVKDADGVQVAADDDGGEGVNSHLLFTFPTDGTYTVHATSYGQDVTGAYNIAVRPFERHPVQPQTLTLDTAVTGRLEAGDGYGDEVGLVDAYDIYLEAGQSVTAVLSDFALGATAYFVSPTGEMVDPDAMYSYDPLNRSFARAEYSGTYRLVVASWNGMSETDYTLVVTNSDDALVATETVEIGRQIEGVREAQASRYALEATAGDQLVATLRSSDFDAYVRVLNPSGLEIASDDDSAGDLDSQAVFIASQDGTYVIEADAYGESGAGAFTLLVEADEPVTVSPVALELGESHSGTLQRGDARGSYGGFVDVFTYDGEAGEQVAFSVGESYETNVRVFSPIGDELQAGMTGSNGTLLLPLTGQYMVTVSSYGAGTVDYTLSVGSGDVAVAVGPAVSVEVGETVSGVLEEGDGSHGRNGFADAYEFTLDEGKSVLISMTSTDTDGYLYLLDETGVELEYNDDHSGLNPGIRTFLAAGTYQVIATEFSRAGGAYTLTVAEQSTVAPSVATIRTGDVVQGVLEETDAYSVMQAGTADFYRLTLESGEGVTIRLNSEMMDSYLTIIDSVGQVVTVNDDGGGNLNSLASFQAALPGDYTIIVSALGEGSDYQLEVEAGYTAPEYEMYEEPFYPEMH